MGEILGGLLMRLGIDFGTTNSAIASYNGQTLARWVLDPGNDNPHVLPSLVYIDRASRVFVVYDAEAPALPNWLRDYDLQEMRIIVDQSGTRRDFVVFAKDFEPGCVKLGGNRAAGQTGDVFMNYFVVIKATL